MSATETLVMGRPSLTFEPLPQRVLGKTGERVPIIGLGTGPGGFGLPDEDAMALYHTAIDRGVTYIDTAPGYGRAHAQLGEVMRERRDEVFLVTKTFTPERDKALEILGQSLRDLQTDCVDLVYAHCVGSYDSQQALSEQGVLAGLREAQRRGWTRYVGFTCHHNPWKAVKWLREAEVDVVMFAMNFADRFTYNLEGQAAALAVERNVGLVAMKVYGGAKDMSYKTPCPSAMDESYDHQLALRYALSLEGVATAVVGMYNETELEQNIAWARRFTPLTASESARLETLGRELSQQWGEHFGSVDDR